MISKKLALEVLNTGLKTGADYAEIYFQDKKTHNITISKKRVDSVAGGLIFGVGIRLLKGDDVIYGYTSDISRNSLLNLTNRLAGALKGEQVVTVTSLKQAKVNKTNAPKKAHDSMSLEDKIKYLRKGEKVAYDYSPLVVDATLVLDESNETVIVYNSEGTMAKDERVRTTVGVQVSASDGKSFERGMVRHGYSMGLEILDVINLEEMVTGASKDAVDLLSAPECPSGEIPVILCNGFGGTLFHEACGHPLEGEAISHNTSTFTGRLGQVVASPLVTAIDDGTIPQGWGSQGYDDEGIKMTKNVLIKDGVLQNYMVDRVSGRKLGMAPTGSCRRQSYRYVPVTRMTNTYIDAGKSTKEEIIAATKKGLLIDNIMGGSVDPTTDKFNFGCSKAYVIIDGKIDHMVKSACLVGFGYDVLMDIDMVGNDLKRAAGTCGASSGSVPVEVGQPTLRVSKMVVGGRGGKF